MPSRIIRNPSPTACAPEAQAVTVQRFGPVRPNRIATCPAEAFAISAGTMNGLTRPGPFSSRTEYCWRSVSMPPMPVAMTTPPRSDWISGEPASSHASCDPAREKCVTRSVRRASFASSQREGSKSGTSPASRTARGEASKCSILRMPFRPFVRPAQNSSTPVPTGVTGPMPVMTTRRASGTDVQLRGHELHGLADGGGLRDPVLGSEARPGTGGRHHRRVAGATVCDESCARDRGRRLHLQSVPFSVWLLLRRSNHWREPLRYLQDI